MNRHTICIKPEELNDSNLVIMEPKVYKPNDSSIKIRSSNILYRNSKGEVYDLYIVLPSIQAYGPFTQYTFNCKNKSKENIKGYSISYSNPIVEEMFEKINKTCQNKINEFV